jgi:hypothetical protein
MRDERKEVRLWMNISTLSGLLSAPAFALTALMAYKQRRQGYEKQD